MMKIDKIPPKLYMETIPWWWLWSKAWRIFVRHHHPVPPLTESQIIKLKAKEDSDR